MTNPTFPDAPPGGVVPVTLDGPAAPESSEEITVHLVPLADIEALIDRGGFLQALHTAPLMRLLLRRRVGG